MAARERVRVPKTPAKTLQLNDTTTPSDPGSVSNPLDRRAALLTIATIMGASAVEALTGLDGAELAAVLNATTRKLRSRLDVGPAEQVYRAITRHADRINRLVATYDDRRMHAAHAEALGRAGFIAYYDLAWPQTATRHLSDALSAAERAGDRELVAWVLCFQAHQATHNGQPELGRRLVGAGFAALAKVEGAPVATSLWLREVTASTLARDERAALAAIEQTASAAQRAYGRVGWLPLTAWTADSRAGACYLAFGRLPQAEQALDRALALMPNWHRDHGTILADRAQLAALRGELEQAAAVASEGLSAAIMSGSRGDQRRTLRPWRHLAPHQRDIPAVRELGEQLQVAGLLPAA